MQYFNPYSETNFFQFFAVLAGRMWAFATGQAGIHDLATDEIQIIVLTGVALSSALVGTFLILRRMTMLANSLSHTILLGIVVAFVLTRAESIEEPINLPAMLLAALGMGIVTTFLTQFSTRTLKLQEDASTGLVFTSLFALGIVLVTVLTRSVHIGTEVVMGNVDALQPGDCPLVYMVLFINILLFTLFFKEFAITTFDPALSRSLGISVLFFNYLLMTQVSATVIGAFRAVGVLMVLAFITGPSLSARLLTHNLKKLIFLAAGFGAAAAFAGVALSRHLLTVFGTPYSTSGIVVCVIFLLFLFAVLYAKLVRKLA